MTEGDRICAWRCAACTRLTLGWCSQPAPVQCSWPTCQSAALDPFPLRRPPPKKEK
jgi:hypothetical protein